jgi:hypothetical protein
MEKNWNGRHTILFQIINISYGGAERSQNYLRHVYHYPVTDSKHTSSKDKTEMVKH